MRKHRFLRADFGFVQYPLPPPPHLCLKNNEMEKNHSKSFTANFEVDSSPQHVFNCIREIPKWWTSDFCGNNAKLHDEFVICHPGAHYSKQQLLELIPGKTLIWLVTESELSWLKNKDEWTGTKMIFDISRNGDKTVLQFTHEGLISEKECYDRCTQGWNMVIKEQLFNFVTDGKTI